MMEQHFFSAYDTPVSRRCLFSGTKVLLLFNIANAKFKGFSFPVIDANN